MATRGRRLKREATVSTNGLPTPDDSFQITIIDGEPTYKVESFRFNSLQSEIDHDRDRRSTSLSLRSSKPPQQISHDTREPTMAPSIPDFSSLGLRVVGQQVNVLVDAINDLRQVGVEHVSEELPELVLVGDQSAGKSSLMGALAEIHLPRRDGRCTLTPTNLKTSPSHSWECKVSLEQTFNFIPLDKDRIIESKHVTKNNPFPSWIPQDLEVKPFKTITQKSELEDVLRWAQIALLNHNQDYRLFIPGSGARWREDASKEEKTAPAKFSPNTISVQIAGPGLPSLSFFDLPGIFAAAEDPKEQYLVKVFENLATKYIKHENALIICAMAMKTDPGNSRTSAIISELKATDRCIGVLTMPDRLPAGHAEFENVLRGRAHIVGRGYFVTKQPGGDSTLSEPNYHKKAREEEKSFFENDILWSGKWSEFRDRCGTDAIQQYLSKAFAEQIAKSMPSIREKILNKTFEIDAQLAALPELPASNVQIEVQRHLSAFSNDVERLLRGESISNCLDNFYSSWAGLCDHFRDLIFHIKPKMRLFHDSDKHPRLPSEVIEIIDEDDTEETMSPLSNRKRPAPQSSPSDRGQKRQINDARIPFSVSSTPRHNALSSASAFQSLKAKDENSPRRLFSASPAPSSQSMGPPSRRSANPFKGTPFEEFSDTGRGFADLASIREAIARHTRPGVPNLQNPDVCNELCMQSVQPWDGPLQVFFTEIRKVMREELDKLLLKHLGRYRETELYRQSGTHLSTFLEQYEMEQQNDIDSLYKLETYQLYTINRASITEHEQKELEILKAERRKTRARFYVERQVQLGRKKISQDPQQKEAEMRKAIGKVTDEELGPDPFKLELEVAAYVRGYYITAATRFIESVCLSINGNLFRKIVENISWHLETKLGVAGASGEERCRALMEEDDSVARRRALLRSEKDKLTQFADRLVQLAEETGCGNETNTQGPRLQSMETDFIDDFQ